MSSGGSGGGPAGGGMMMAPGCLSVPPRHMQQMPPEMSHYGGVPTSQMAMNPITGMPYYPGQSPNLAPTSSSASNTPSMSLSNGMYQMSNVPNSAVSSMSMSRLPDMSQQIMDNSKWLLFV